MATDCVPTRAGRARLVVDDDRLLERPLQRRRQRPGGDVGDAARRERHHDGHRTRRIGLIGGGREHGGEQAEGEQERLERYHAALTTLEEAAVSTRFLVTVLVDGALTGALYALVALSFVVVYRNSRMINFALGEWTMLGSGLVAASSPRWGWACRPASRPAASG